ncbi:major facilitator superfamily domain-containing protein [Mariannaea sp. PMI_226]|nr:major facilitator superfamily domain-containing protein [Mariannaea sp. PMI_226]
MERRLQLKIDLYVVPSIAIIWLFYFIDRTNIGNAHIASMNKSLQLKDYNYNILLFCFYILYILLKFLTTILYKWIGPGWFILTTTLMFGICTIATGFVQTQCSLLPGIAYYLSRWYRRAELAFRLSLYLVISPLAGAFGGLLASGILKLDSFGSLTKWRMIFGIEGIVIYLLDVIEEKEICRTRIQLERLVQMGEIFDKVDKVKLWRGAANPATLSTAIAFLFSNIIVQGLGVFLPSIISTIYPNRSIFLIGVMLTIIIGYILFFVSKLPNVWYVVSANVVSDTSRSSAIIINISPFLMLVLFGNIGGLISSWIFLAREAPNYPIGNGLNLVCAIMQLIVILLALIWFKWDNKKRRHCNSERELARLT